MRSRLRYGEPSQGSNGRAADRLLGLGDGTPPNSEACGVQVKSPTYDSSKMSLELPLDVWLHLLKFKHLMNDSVSLSITCKALREILLPTLSFGKTPLSYCGIKDIEAFLSPTCSRSYRVLEEVPASVSPRPGRYHPRLDHLPLHVRSHIGGTNPNQKDPSLHHWPMKVLSPYFHNSLISSESFFPSPRSTLASIHAFYSTRILRIFLSLCARSMK